MPAAQPTGFGSEVLQPFNIPTSAPSPIQKAPNVGLTFPVFTPPAASSYGTTNPMAVPWSPPDLAGAINRGIETGAHLATDAIANKKSLQEISAEEQAQKIAIARASQPGAGYYTTTSLGGPAAKVETLSPAQVEMQRAELANRQATAQAELASAAERRGETPEARATIAQREAETKKTEVQTSMLGQNVFQRTAAQLDSGHITPNTTTPTTTPTQPGDYTGVVY